MRATPVFALTTCLLLLGGCAESGPAVTSQGTPSTVAVLDARPASPEGQAVASLALANMGKPAGTCAVTPATNSLGESDFEHSCDGWNKEPEYWCADFVIWTWRKSGLDVAGLNAASGSFRTYGTKHGSLVDVPHAGDAIVFNKGGDGTATHVAVVTAVHPDGSVDLANGDWQGEKGSQAHFARTSRVVATTLSASEARVGAGPIAAQDGLFVVAIVSPVKATSSSKATPTASLGTSKASAKASPKPSVTPTRR